MKHLSLNISHYKIIVLTIAIMLFLTGCSNIPEETSKATSGETSISTSSTETSFSSTSKKSETTSSENSAASTSKATAVHTTKATAATISKTTAVLTSEVTTAPTTKATTVVSTTKTTTVPTTKATTIPTTKATTIPTTKATTVPTSIAQGAYTPINHNEMKAVWISYLELANSYAGYSAAPLLKGRTANDFRVQMQGVYENCLSIGINTVFVHVRPFGDALYPSALFPSSYVVTGTAGAALPFDPLAIMIEEAHKKGISFHAWINPYRAQPVADAASIAKRAPGSQFAKWYNDPSKNGDYLVAFGSKYYYNPSVKEVRQLLISGVEELMLGYKVDGIHIDDYFYPSGIGTDFDAAAYFRYIQDGGTLSLADFRRDSNNQTVSGIYKKIKSINNRVLFSVSPSGNLSYNYNTMYTDVKLWLKTEGYLDVIIPQVYYGFQNAALPYSECIETWNSLITVTSIKLVFGLAAYKVGNSDKYAGAGANEWIENAGFMLNPQISEAKKQSWYSGYALFDYKSLFFPAPGKVLMIQQELSSLL